KVKTLRLVEVNEGAVLDASELLAQEIIVGSVNGRSRVLLQAATAVTVREINDQSHVTIEAPAGRGSIQGINDGCQVSVLAREIDFRRAINGSATQVLATITSGGRLHFAELNNGARLHWKKQQPADPEPMIEQGKIQGRSDFRRLD